MELDRDETHQEGLFVSSKLNSDAVNNWPVTIALPQGLTIGGMTTWALTLADGLARRGREVRLVAHAPLHPGHVKLDATSLKLHKNVRVIDAAPLAMNENWQSCVETYRQLLPTVLFPNVIAECYALAAALTMTQPDAIRVVGWNHSDNIYDYTHLAYYEPIIYRFVVNTRQCETELTRHLPTRKRDTIMLRHGIQLGAVSTRTPAHGRPLRLIYGGRMEQLVKRVLDLPRLAAMLDERGIKFELRLVGDGPQSNDVDRLIDQTQREMRDSNNRIYRVEPVTPAEMQSHWRWADVSLLPSTHEGLSVAMLEAMAAGCVPVVTRINSGVAEIIDDGINGFTFHVCDLPAMTAQIVRLAQEPDILARISQAARASINSEFDFDAYVQRVNFMFDEIVAEPDRSWSAHLPISMNSRAVDAGSHPGTIPSDADVRLRNALHDLADRGHRHIAIYGAGAHTRALANVWADSPVNICAVLADDPTQHGEYLWGWKVIAPQSVLSTGASAIVLSSWMHEDVMRKNCRRFIGREMEVVSLYAKTEETPKRAETLVAV